MKPEEIFIGGMNCSQSVFYPFAKDFFNNSELAFKIMSPFGGGIAYTNRICGAVTGGIAAIGLYLGHTDSSQAEQKAKCVAATREFLKRFQEKQKSTDCTQLIKYNLSVEEEAKKANEEGVFKTICPELVKSSAQLVIEILEEYGVKDINLKTEV
ncbi:MAG: C_GCAxxG_C_C family protein [Bacteroidales bacterium]|nr:C_GCAxxG_C_C family protein [Bacteroidales bacterium]MBN2818943.1 C_GCAxxG_C_C family protein [Bacteroidales bacterium]